MLEVLKMKPDSDSLKMYRRRTANTSLFGRNRTATLSVWTSKAKPGTLIGSFMTLEFKASDWC